MLELLSIICYGVIGFGLGGIAFKDSDKNKTLKAFNIFKNDKEKELLQINVGKNKQSNQIQELTKDNVELQKKYNRSVRNSELLIIKSTENKTKGNDDINKGMDDILNI